MLRKLDTFLTICMIVAVGAFVGTTIDQYIEFRRHLEPYVTSAPWYTSVIVAGIVTVVILAICIIAKMIIRKRSKV